MELIQYFSTAGDKHGWAIDEDRRLIRRALRDVAREAPLWSADVVHSPFWMALDMHDPRVVRRRFVIAHADNPPFFYLTQPEFAAAQKTVNLWIARSREAMEQFAALGLPSAHVPYAIDESLFFPIPDRTGLRAKYGIPRDAYVIGNFHRDSEGADLSQPKLQKAPETLVAILRMVCAEGLQPHVLLAGPRRHWLRAALAREAIPFTYIGQADIGGDDFGVNILTRSQLNELYNVCDLYLVPSRWEGGPQSVMEAAAARVKILSFPLGVACDILRQESLFDTHSQAASKIVKDMRDGFLAAGLEEQRQRLLAHHTADAMAAGLRRIYDGFSKPMVSHQKDEKRAWCSDFVREITWQVLRRLPRQGIRSVRISHATGIDSFMDEAIANLVCIFGGLGVSIDGGEDAPVVAGCSESPSLFRLLPPGGADTRPSDNACRIALSVQDAVNFKSGGHKSPVVVCPLVFQSREKQPQLLVVGDNDKEASLDIWRCMLSGGVAVYPRESAYYYQIFHGGVPYGGERSRDDAADLARQYEETLHALARPPTLARAKIFWDKLLRQ